MGFIESSLLKNRFHADPSGTFMQYDAKAIGSGSEGAQTELQEEYHKSLTLQQAETLSLKVLKQSVVSEFIARKNDDDKLTFHPQKKIELEKD
ncbi:4730_t:CDS:2, partial [Acaulospora colombiana]